MTDRPVIDLDGYLEGIVLADEEAFADWIAGAERPLRLSLRRFAAAVDTESILQETLLRIWLGAGRCEPDGRPNALLRFARRVAVNLAIDEVRRRRAEVPHDRPGGGDGGGSDGGGGDDAVADPDPPPDPLLRDRILECLEALPRAPGLAIRARLHAAGGDSDATLAARLGMRLNTFLQNVTRARRLVARCLEQAGIGVPA